MRRVYILCDKATVLRRAHLAIFLCAISFVTSACRFDSQSQAQEGFVPLAGVKISISDANAARLEEILREFAEAENLRVQEGNFTKRGRPVINMVLQVNEKTFFHVDDFRDNGLFDLNVYSHEKKEVWEPIWLRLTKKLREVFGAKNIKKKFSE